MTDEAPSTLESKPGGLAFPPVEPHTPRPSHEGAALVLVPDAASREALAALAGSGVDPEGLHLTLFYFGPVVDVGPAVAAFRARLQEYAAGVAAVTTAVAGYVRLRGAVLDTLAVATSSDAVYALRAWAESVVAEIRETAPVPGSAHPFLPHVSLRALAPGEEWPTFPLPETLRFDRLALWSGVQEVAYPLDGGADSVAPMSDPANAAPVVAPRPAVPFRVVPFGDGDALLTRDGEDWNRAHAVGRLRAWASTDASGDWSTMAWDQYARGFLFVDDARPDTWDAYLLPHHDVIGGELRVSRKGLLSAAASLMNGTSGVPEEAVQEAQDHLERHFAQFGMDPPWLARAVTPTALAAEGEGLPPGVISRSVIQVARVGAFKGHRAGDFEFTPAVFDTIIRNFERTANRHVPVDYEHTTERMDGTIPLYGAPAVGWIVALENRGELGLWGTVEWVDQTAVDYIRAGQYRYFSPAVVFNAVHPETAEELGPALVSGALTNRPFLDGMEPVVARHGETPVTAAAEEPAPVRGGGTAAPATSVTPSGTEGGVSTPDQTSAPAAHAVTAPAPSRIEPSPRTEAFRAAVVAARDGSGNPHALSWWDGEGFEDKEDLIGFLRMMFNLSAVAGESEIRAAVARLRDLLSDPGRAAAEGVDLGAIMADFRRCLSMPVLAPGGEILDAIEGALATLPSEAAMGPGPADVTTEKPLKVAPMGDKPPKEPAPMSTATETTPDHAAALVTLRAENERLTAALNAVTAERDAARAAAESASAAHKDELAKKDETLAAMSARVLKVETEEAERVVDGRIAAEQIQASARAAAVSLRLSNRETFDALYPAPAPKAAEAPKDPAAEVTTAMNAGAAARPAAGPVSAMTGATPPAPAPAAMRRDELVHNEALRLMSAGTFKEYRDAMLHADATLPRG